MSLLEMQRVLGKVLTDETLRNAFLSDPNSVFSGYRLTPREAESLSKIDTERLKIYADSLKEGRVGLALTAFPMTRFLMAKEIKNFVTRYCQEVPPLPVTSSPMFNEAKLFYGFLTRLAADGEIKAKYVADVLEYEKTLFFIANSVEASSSAAAFAGANREMGDDLGGEMIWDLKPVKGAHAETASFNYDVVELSSHLVKEEMPELGPKRTLLLFSKIPGEVGVRTLKINKATMDLISRCDRTKTTGTILSELATAYNKVSEPEKANLVAACLRILKKLYNSSVIMFDK
jgi:hypothetical protein